jgi:hypothetical protein
MWMLFDIPDAHEYLLHASVLHKNQHHENQPLLSSTHEFLSAL